MAMHLVSCIKTMKNHETVHNVDSTCKIVDLLRIHY